MFDKFMQDIICTFDISYGKSLKGIPDTTPKWWFVNSASHRKLSWSRCRKLSWEVPDPKASDPRDPLASLSRLVFIH